MANDPPPWSVHPANAFTVARSAASSSSSAPTVYQIVPVAAELPVIDNTKTVKWLLLSESMAQRRNRIFRRHRQVMLVSYFAGLASIGVGFLASLEIARFVAVASCVAMLPAQVSYVLHMRYEFIKLLDQSFEFWYTTTLVLLWTASGATMVGDARLCSLLMSCLGMELQLLGDACTRPMRSIVFSALLSVVLCGGFMGFAAFGLIEQTKTLRVTVSRDGRPVISNRDVFVNTTLPLMILGTRLAYNKYQALKYPRSRKQSMAPTPPAPAVILPSDQVDVVPGVRCMAYRCQLTLRPCTQTAQSHTRLFVASSSLQQPPSLIPLRAVRIRELIHVGHTLLPRLNPTQDAPIALRLLYKAVGLTGQLACASSFVSAGDDATDGARVAVALGCTSVYCGYFLCVSHRSLLRRLFRSFDFVFVLAQITLEIIAVADLYRWQGTASLGGALPCWMWFWHVMTLDAITPLIKQRLGFRAQYLASCVLLLFIVGRVWLAIEMLVYSRLGFQDRIFAELDLGAAKTFKLKAASFALTRALTSFVWSARLLWRIWTSPDALIMLQGLVEFDYVRHGIPSRVSAAPVL